MNQEESREDNNDESERIMNQQEAGISETESSRFMRSQKRIKQERFTYIREGARPKPSTYIRRFHPAFEGSSQLAVTQRVLFLLQP